MALPTVLAEQPLQSIALSIAFLLSATAHTDPSDRAAFVGQRFSGAVDGAPVLVCVYTGAAAKFEIVSQTGKCATFIEVR